MFNRMSLGREGERKCFNRMSLGRETGGKVKGSV